MLPWKQRGTGKPAKGINLREMLSRLSRTETEAKREVSHERQEGVPTAQHGGQAGDNASSMLARYFSSDSDQASSQSGFSSGNTPKAQRQNEQSVMPSAGFGIPPAHSQQCADEPAHSQQCADEIVSDIARKLAARQYVPKFDVVDAFPGEAGRDPPPAHAYMHGFEPAPRVHLERRDQTEDDFAEPVSQARLPQKSTRFSAIAKGPTAVTVPPSSKRRILFATAGGFGIAIAAIAAAVLVNRAPPPQPVDRIETVAAVSPAIETVVPARPHTAPSAPPVSTFVASLGSVPSAAPAAGKPTPSFRIDDIAAPAGSADVAFPVSLDGGGGSTGNLRIVVTEMPSGVGFNRGAKARDGSWIIRPQDLDGLRLTISPETNTSRVTVTLVSDGVQVAQLSPTIAIEPATDFRVSLGKNDNEDKARGLFEKGEVRLGNGDVIGARMFFKKAADAGDAQAANAMGATYDPDLFSSLRVQGMRPDVEMARQWYRRAMELGSKDSLDRLERLKSR